MHARRLAISFLCLAATATGAGAEPVRATLTLSSAVRSALRHDPEIAVADAAVSMAEGGRQRAAVVVPANPILSAARASDGPLADTGEQATTIAVSQEFWAPGQRSARIQAADAGLEAARRDRDWVVRRVATETAVAFVRLASAERREAILQELGDLLLRVDDAAGRRQDVGDMSEFERNQVRLDSVASGADLARQRGELATAREGLARRMGSPVGDEVTLADVPGPIAWNELERLARAASATARPDVVAAAHEVERAKSGVVVERRERRPRPTITLGWDEDRSVLLGDDFSGLPFPKDSIKVSDEDRLLSIGVSFALPVFDLNKGGITQAIASRVLAEAELVRRRRDAESQVRELLAQGRLLSQVVETLGPATVAGATNVGVAERAWSSGQISLADLLRERDRVLRSRLTAEDATTALVVTELRLAASVDALRLFAVPSSSDPGAEAAAPTPEEAP